MSANNSCSEECRNQTLSDASTIDVCSNFCCREDAAFSFNGGKDSTVLLHLIRAAVEQRQLHGQVQPRSSSAATGSGMLAANSTSGGAASAKAVEPGAENRDGQAARPDGLGTTTCAEGDIHNSASSLPEGPGAAAEGVGATARSTLGGSPMMTRIRTFVFHRPDDFLVRPSLQRVPILHLKLLAGSLTLPAPSSSLF